MKLSLKRTAALILALLMTVALCACDKKPGSGGSDDPYAGLEKVRLEHVYSVKYIDFDGEDPEPTPTPDFSGDNYSYSDEYITDVSEVNGKIYLTCQYYNEKYVDDEYTYDNGIRVYSMNLDGSDYKVMSDFKSTMEQGENYYSYSGVENVFYCSDGTYWYTESTGYDDWSDPNEYKYEYYTTLVHADADGSELASLDTKSLAEDNNGYFYINTVFTTDDGKLVIYSDQKILIFDGELNLLNTVQLENVWINSLAMTGSGDILAIVYDNNTGERSFRRFDVEGGKLEELDPLPADIYEIQGGPGNTVLFGSGSGSSLYSYDYVTGEKSELLNWINSDINPNRMSNIKPLSNGDFVAMEYSRDYSKRRIALLSRVSDSDVVEKYVIDFAAVYLDNNLQDAIIEFNKQNDTFRIRYVDYSVYNTEEDYSGGTKQLNLDIISGKIPDIISLQELPFTTYASKGLLADIGALMDADESFVRDNYMTNVLEAPSYKGKIYSVIPFYEVMTAVGKTDIVGDKMGWTIDDMQALVEQYPDSEVFGATERYSVLNSFSMMALNKFIDDDTGTCSFNSEDFIKMLEFINTFPETIDWDSLYSDDSYWMKYDNAFRSGETLLQTYWVYDYNSLRSLMSNFGGDVTFIGYPVPEGVGSVIYPDMELAISSKTKLTAPCWDFIKYLLSDDFQENGYALPLKRSVLDKAAAEAMDPSRYSDMGYVYGVATDSVAMPAPAVVDDGYVDYWNKPLTQEQVDKVNAAITSATSVSRDMSAVMAIIEEEAGAYFSGQKTAKDVANIIQSRVQIYVSETR